MPASDKRAGTITVTLRRSLAGCTGRQRACARGLGLSRLRGRRVLEDTPPVRGMIKKILHLLDVEGPSC